MLIFKANQPILNEYVEEGLTKGAKVIKNEEDEAVSLIKHYKLIVIRCEGANAVKIYNSILKQIELEYND